MTVRKRRSGGSKARRAIRQNKEKEAIVFPGLEGGQYKPLSDSDIQKIHKTALDVLENIGIGDPIPEILDHTLDKGCILGDDTRLKFPRSLVEDLLDIAPIEHLMYAITQNTTTWCLVRKHTYPPQGSRFQFLNMNHNHFAQPHWWIFMTRLDCVTNWNTYINLDSPLQSLNTARINLLMISMLPMRQFQEHKKALVLQLITLNT